MKQRIDIITLRTPDVDAASDFYRSKLGWTPLLEVPGEIAFFQIGHGQVLGLFDAEGFDNDIGEPNAHTFAFAHNVDSRHDVDTAARGMVQAGAGMLKSPQRADFGGYHAYLTDPSGTCWEIAHNPGWSVAADGSVTIEPIEDA